MSYKAEDVVIIFQGYSDSDQSFIDQVNYYHNLGFKQIVVSTYTKFVKDIKDKLNELEVKIVLNDEGNDLKFATTNDKKRTNSVEINFEEPVFPETETNPNWEKIINRNRNPANVLRKYRIINCLLQTTKRGLRLADQEFPNAKYYLKIRLDMRLGKLNEKITEWLPKMEIKSTEDENLVYNHKLCFCRISHTPWSVSDFWCFGYKEDVNKYFDIPFIKKLNELPTGSHPVETYISIAGFKKNKVSLDFPILVKKYMLFDSSQWIKLSDRHKEILKPYTRKNPWGV